MTILKDSIKIDELQIKDETNQKKSLVMQDYYPLYHFLIGNRR